MRLWSLHPSLLDRQGLVACWREALLAQAVLLGRTRGYTKHPQLERFRAHGNPTDAIGVYLAGLYDESLQRGYQFNPERISLVAEGADVAKVTGYTAKIAVTFGQLGFEWSHLRAKLYERSPDFLHNHAATLEAPGQLLPVHPLFTPVAGKIATWERA